MQIQPERIARMQGTFLERQDKLDLKKNLLEAGWSDVISSADQVVETLLSIIPEIKQMNLKNKNQRKSFENWSRYKEIRHEEVKKALNNNLQANI